MLGAAVRRAERRERHFPAATTTRGFSAPRRRAAVILAPALLTPSGPAAAGLEPFDTGRSDQPVVTSDGGIERRRALKVSAHQSGSLITDESSHCWPAGLWPAEIGAPRRS